MRAVKPGYTIPTSSYSIDAIDRVDSLGSKGAHVREKMKNEIIENLQYAYANGVDSEEIKNWKWPF